MHIRKAESKDINRILELLSQVLEIHAALRPDIFISGTTKYSHEELEEMLSEENRLIFVAVNEDDVVNGYAFCEIREQRHRENQVPFMSIYIDDICVDEKAREQHIGQALFECVRNEAKKLGCYEITLNVWEGNDAARKFYEKMGFKIKCTTMEYIV